MKKWVIIAVPCAAITLWLLLSPFSPDLKHAERALSLAMRCGAVELAPAALVALEQRQSDAAGWVLYPPDPNGTGAADGCAEAHAEIAYRTKVGAYLLKAQD
ncbi:MAG: hypothetical protein AAFY52_00220 [Pseudomonadota bacterium]